MRRRTATAEQRERAVRESEVALARPLVAWLRTYHWEVHQEVLGADIVAKQGPLLWVIEVKRQLGFGVIEQAVHWTRGFAHYVSVATPPLKRARGQWVAHHTLRELGVGWLELRPGCDPGEKIAPALHRRTPLAAKLRERLCEETMHFLPAGSPGGGGWTPFKATCREVERACLKAGVAGVLTSDLVASISHHYHRPSTAKSCLVHWARASKIPGVVFDESVRPARWYALGFVPAQLPLG